MKFFQHLIERIEDLFEYPKHIHPCKVSQVSKYRKYRTISETLLHDFEMRDPEGQEFHHLKLSPKP